MLQFGKGILSQKIPNFEKRVDLEKVLDIDFLNKDLNFKDTFSWLVWNSTQILSPWGKSLFQWNFFVPLKNNPEKNHFNSLLDCQSGSQVVFSMQPALDDCTAFVLTVRSI